MEKRIYFLDLSKVIDAFLVFLLIYIQQIVYYYVNLFFSHRILSFSYISPKVEIVNKKE